MVAATEQREIRPVAPVLRTLLIGFALASAGSAVLTRLDTVGAVESVVAPVVYVVGATLVWAHWGSGTHFGAANTVTLTRLIGTSWLTALMTAAIIAELDRPARIALVVVGSTCLLLDGVDGRLARARAESSAFGAHFDMEVDAAMLLVLSVAVVVLGLGGWWVVAIGLMRYASAVASWLVPILRVPVFYSYARKVVAGIQGIALLFATLMGLVPGIPRSLSTTVLATALGLLCWSFGRDIVWQIARSRRGENEPYRPSM